MSRKIVAERIAKLELLRKRGIEPYPTKFAVTQSSSGVLSDFETLEKEQKPVSLAGRLISKRSHGKASFGHILDRAGKLQVYFREDSLGAPGYELFTLLDVGDIVGVKGPVFKTRTGEITIKAEELALLCKSLRPLPEKWHGLKDIETRYRQRYIDLVVNTEVRKLFVTRSRMITAARRFLDARGFIEVETPALQPLYGGAFARPFVTHHEALDMDLFLRISDELYLKRLIVGGLERVYEIGRDFRNEGMDKTHNPEFTQLELYQAFADYEDMMVLLEEMICEIVREVCDGLVCTYGEHQLEFSRPWRRIKYFDALEEHLGVDLSRATAAEIRSLCLKLGLEIADVSAESSAPSMLRGKLLDELFSERVQPHLIQPTFVYDYPSEVSPLARRKLDSPDIAERFEPIIAGTEIGNAFSEQNDPLEQERQFDLMAAARTEGALEIQPKDEDFLRALQYGMPPTGGLGIGIDRLTMILTNSRSIREVILFPQLRPEACLDEEGEDDGENEAEEIE